MEESAFSSASAVSFAVAAPAFESNDERDEPGGVGVVADDGEWQLLPPPLLLLFGSPPMADVPLPPLRFDEERRLSWPEGGFSTNKNT